MSEVEEITIRSTLIPYDIQPFSIWFIHYQLFHVEHERNIIKLENWYVNWNKTYGFGLKLRQFNYIVLSFKQITLGIKKITDLQILIFFFLAFLFNFFFFNSITKGSGIYFQIFLESLFFFNIYFVYIYREPFKFFDYRYFKFFKVSDNM